MTSSVADAPRSPGRPRSTRADEAIVEAALDLLAEGTSVEALSMEAVAARAGVGKATIYRRWPNKDALLLDAVRTLRGTAPTPEGRSVREDLVMLLGSMSTSHDSRWAKIMPCMVAEVNRSEEHYRLYQESVEQRRDVMRGVLRRGIRTGELRPDLDIELTTLLLASPMLIQNLLRWHPGVDLATMPERVVDAVLAGLATRP